MNIRINHTIHRSGGRPSCTVWGRLALAHELDRSVDEIPIIDIGGGFRGSNKAGNYRVVRNPDRDMPQIGGDRPVPPIPMLLTCPCCCARHIDTGEFATKPHHTHACQNCGMTWRPAVENTVGVTFLPGFKNEAPSGNQVLRRRCYRCCPQWPLCNCVETG